jgi:exopolyphosphatase / guanosine-5'-triphosphate,3'-diphosphate pyrophosphatase
MSGGGAEGAGGGGAEGAGGGDAEGAGAPVPSPLVASVIDIGSNSVLLLTLDVSADGRARQLDAALTTTRLGSGLADGGALDPAACIRTRDAVVAQVERARASGAERCWAFATGAARRASDGRTFAAELARVAGCPVEVLSGDEEAMLAYAAVSHAFGDDARALLAVDVGGATTELTLGRGGGVEARTSLPLGALALTEGDVDAAPEVERVLAATGLPAQAAGAEVVCSGGTATALAALDLGLVAYDAARVHSHTLPVARLDGLARHARPLPGVLDEGRAQILPAGALVLACVARAARSPTIRVSEHGVRHAYLRRRLALEGIDADLRALWT